MKVLFAVSEAAPFMKTGGLGDVAGSLPIALKNKDIDTAVIMPLYPKIRCEYNDKLEFIGSTYMHLAWRSSYVGIFKLTYENVDFYFIDNEYYFKRSSCYGEADDGERFAYFSKAVLEVLRTIDFVPDIIHLHDWQTGLIPLLLRDAYSGVPEYKNIKTVFTIHNIEYQGKCGLDFPDYVLGASNWSLPVLRQDECTNFMKGAIVMADKVTTVSETYSYEIRNEYYAHGLSYILNQNAYKLCGIVNGIDYNIFNPETDKYIYSNYSLKKLSGKAENKLALQKELGLEKNADAPIIAMITRLTGHKGIDLVKCIFHDLMQKNVQFVLLGTGEAEYENFFRDMQNQYPGKVSANITFNNELSHKIYAASDIYLMPSKAEPCGLSQLIAMRYGTIPVVRETGGLVDTVKPYNPENDEGTGFTFKTYNAHDMLDALSRAADAYSNKTLRRKLIKKCMQYDSSWDASADKYIDLYYDLLK